MRRERFRKRPHGFLSGHITLREWNVSALESQNSHRLFNPSNKCSTWNNPRNKIKFAGKTVACDIILSIMKKYIVKVIIKESHLVEVFGDTEESARLKARDGIGSFVKFPVIETHSEVVQGPAEDGLTLFQE